MSDHCTSTRTQAPDKNAFAPWERQLFDRVRRCTRSPGLDLYAVSLPCSYQERKTVKEFTGPNSERNRELKKISDENMAMIMGSFVRKLTDEECRRRDLLLMRWKQLLKELDTLHAYILAKIDDKMEPPCDVSGETVPFSGCCDAQGLITYFMWFGCMVLICVVFGRAL
ncbi:hypothetical protein EAE96_007443 [Botrytis aclada]|nr:hypothetical protein EAE96_007443 [Botrytis aclada]